MNDEVSVPDTDDWTWVLDQRCPQCGVDVQKFSSAEVTAAATGYVQSFRSLLENSPDVAVRPTPDTWSPLEYGAHLRDVCNVFRTRIRAMLLHDQPSYEDWDQNLAAAAYGQLEPVDVADELKNSAGDLLRDVEALTSEEAARTGHRSDGFTFTVETLLQYYLHELVHHWWDVSGERYQLP